MYKGSPVFLSARARAVQDVALRNTPQQHVVVVVPERLRSATGVLVVRVRKMRVHERVNGVAVILAILDEHRSGQPPGEEIAGGCSIIPALAV